MGRVTRLSLYTLTGRFYDRLVPKQARLWARVRRRLLRTILPQVRAVCDLGCGSGTTALEFARRGFQVVAVDLSPTLCRLARQKARRQHLPVRVIRGDMRSFRLPERVDLVTCEFDSLNHLPRQADLGRVARAVARALRPGGYFYFDVNNRRAFEELWAGMLWMDRREFTLVARGGYDHRSHKGWAEFDWFLPQGKRWRRYRERLQEVWWTRAQIEQSLRRAGFRRVRAWDAARLISHSRYVRPGSRTFYLAQKLPLGGGRVQELDERG